jgi:hypothetical protein
MTDSVAALGRVTAPAALIPHRAKDLRPGMVHLGLGNFHRAHQAIYTAAAIAAASRRGGGSGNSVTLSWDMRPSPRQP